MARRSQHSFLKRQKEIKRKETAAEKMARRQGKIERSVQADQDDRDTGHAVESQTEDEGEVQNSENS